VKTRMRMIGVLLVVAGFDVVQHLYHRSARNKVLLDRFKKEIKVYPVQEFITRPIKFKSFYSNQKVLAFLCVFF
jgi:hypothetical protein